MKNKDIVKLLKKESKNFIPDIKDKVYENIGFKEVKSERKPLFKFNYKFGLSFVLILFLLLISYISFIPSAYSKSYVIVDINPSLELVLDKFDKIKEINPLNPDGLLLLQEIDEELIGGDITPSILKIVIASNNNDYIDINNSESVVRVISVNKNKDKENNLKDKLDKNIRNIFEKNNIKSNLLTSDDVVFNEAKEYNISLGKMYIIKKALELDKTLTLKKALKLDLEKLIKLTNEKANNKLKQFKTSFDENLKPLDNSKNQAIKKLDDEYSNLSKSIKQIEQLIADRKSIIKIKKELKDLADTYNYDIELNFNNLKEAKAILDEIRKESTSDYNFKKDIINDKYNIQKYTFKQKVINDLKNSDDFKFNFDFDDDFSFKDHKNGLKNEDEKRIISVIQKILTLINIDKKNPIISIKVLEKIEDLHQEYINLMNEDNISNEFKNSDLIIDFNNKYQEFKKNLKIY